jgi:hypothetical protein
VPGTGSPTGPDTVAPKLTITAEQPAYQAPYLRAPFLLQWSEPVNGFTLASVAVETQVGEPTLEAVPNQPNTYRIKVALPFDAISSRVTVAQGAVKDAAGNDNVGPVSAASPTGGAYDAAGGDGSAGGGGEGGTGDGGGGDAGDGGSPGTPPPILAVTPVVEGTNLRLNWSKVAGSPTVFYQLIFRDSPQPHTLRMGPGPAAVPPAPAVEVPVDVNGVPINGDEDKKVLINNPKRFGKQIPAVYSSYSVLVPVLGERVYRVRSCNTAPADPQTSTPNATGSTGCSDSFEFDKTGVKTGYCPSAAFGGSYSIEELILQVDPLDPVVPNQRKYNVPFPKVCNATASLVSPLDGLLR